MNGSSVLLCFRNKKFVPEIDRKEKREKERNRRISVSKESTMGDCNIKVVVRFRPFNDREKSEVAKSGEYLLDYADGSSIHVQHSGKAKQSFTFDQVLPPSCSQACLFLIIFVLVFN